MAHPLDRDVLLGCLRDDPPTNVRALARANDDCPGFSLMDHVHVLDAVLAEQPPRVSLTRLHTALHATQGEGMGAPELWESYHTLCAMSWWLVCANARPVARTKMWQSARITHQTTVRGHLVIAGDLELADYGRCPGLLVWGDLIVTGDVTGYGNVFVGGSIEVRGSWRTEDAMDMVLVTGGDVRVGRVFEASTTVFLGGRLEAPLVHLNSYARTNRLLGGACAILFDDHDGTSSHPVPPDASLVWSPHMATPNGALEASIRGTLHPDRLEPFGDLDASDEMFWDAVWDDVFNLGLSLELLFTSYALEVFRNQSGDVLSPLLATQGSHNLHFVGV